MKIIRKTVDGAMEDLYLVDDAGNEIRGIVAHDSSVVHVEVFEGNFDLLLSLMPSDGMTYFTKASMQELAALIVESRAVDVRDALQFVSFGIDKILRRQARPEGAVRILNRAAEKETCDQEWLG